MELIELSSCPLIANGLLRILGQSSDPQGPGSPAAGRVRPEAFTAKREHQFWPDNASRRVIVNIIKV